MAQQEAVCAPHLLDAEVGQTLRRFLLRGDLSAARARVAIGRLQSLPLRRYSHTRLVSRAFEFRDNATVYDGLYLALAEALDAPLLTCDARLRDVPGCSATVEVLPVTPAGRGD